MIGLEAHVVLAKEQNARDFAMESGLAHDEARRSKLSCNSSCWILGSQHRSKLTSWQEVAPTEDDSSGEAKMST